MTQFEDWYSLYRQRTEEEKLAKEKDEFKKFEDWYDAYRKDQASPVPDVTDLVKEDAVSSVAIPALEAFGVKAQDIAKEIVGFVESVPGKIKGALDGIPDVIHESFERAASGEATAGWADKTSPLGQFTPGEFGNLKEFLPTRSPAGVLVQSPRMRRLMDNLSNGAEEFVTEIIPHMVEGIARLTPPGAALSVQEHYLDKADRARLKKEFDAAGIKLDDDVWKSPLVPEGLKMGSDVVVGFLTFIPQTLKGFFENPVDYMTEHPFDVALLLSMMTPKGLKIAKKAKWKFDNRAWFKLIDSIPEEAMSLRMKQELVRNVKLRGDSLEATLKGWLEGEEVASRRAVMKKLEETKLQRDARHVKPKEVPEGVFEPPDIGAPLPKPLLEGAREKATKKKPMTILEKEDALKRRGGLEEEAPFIGEEPPGAFQDMSRRLTQEGRDVFQQLLDDAVKRDPDYAKMKPEEQVMLKVARAKILREQMKEVGGDMGTLAELLEKEIDISTGLTKQEQAAWEKTRITPPEAPKIEKPLPKEPKPEKVAEKGLERAKEDILIESVDTMAPIDATAVQLKDSYNVVPGGKVTRGAPKEVGAELWRGDVQYIIENSAKELLPAKAEGKYITGENVYQAKNVKTGEVSGWLRDTEMDIMFHKESVEGFYPGPEVPLSFSEWADKHGVAKKFGKEPKNINKLVDEYMRDVVQPETQFKDVTHPAGLSGKAVEKVGPFKKETVKEAKGVAEKAVKERTLRKERRAKIYEDKSEMTPEEMKSLLEEVEGLDEGMILDTDIMNLYSGYPFVKEIKESFKRLAKGDIVAVGKALPAEANKAIAVTQFPDLAKAVSEKAEAIFDIPNIITEGKVKVPKGKVMWEVPLGVEQRILTKKILNRLEGMRFPNEALKTHMEYLNNILKKGEIIIPEDALTHVYKDIKDFRQGMAQPHYWLPEIDGTPSWEALAKMADNATPMMKYVLYRSHDLMLQSLKYENIRSTHLADVADTYRIQAGGPADILAGEILGKIGYDYHKIPLEQLAKKPGIDALVKKASSPKRGMELLKAAVEARNWYNDAFKAQNLARELRGQPTIPFRQFYTPDSLRAYTIFERASTMKQSFENFLKDVDLPQGKAIPDFAVPNKPFNPRELAKKHGLEDAYKVKGMVNQMKEYLPFEVKDIYYTSIIKNNKAFAKMLKNTDNKYNLPGGRTYEHSSKGIMSWTGEAFGGLRSGIDRTLGITSTQAKWMATFRGALHRSVFPGYVAWSAFIQTSSANLTFARYGLKAGIKGLKWFTDKALRDWLMDNTFALQTKTIRAGDIVRQELNEGLLRTKAMDNPKFLDKVENMASFMIREMEKHLTGWSTATAKAWLDAKGHPVNRSYLERISEGGAKTQSLYHLEDRPGYLRSQIMRTAAPFQTFSFEVFNTIGEMLGRTGIKDAKTKVRVGKALRFLGGAMAVNFVVNSTVGRKPWGLDSAVPFYNVIIGPIVEGRATTRHLPSPVGIAAELKKAITGYIDTGDWDNLRQWMIKYGSSYLHIPGGTALNNLTEGLIAIAEGGVNDSAGRMHFPVKGLDEKLRAVTVGPYRTQAGQEWLKERGGKEKAPSSPIEKQKERLREAKKGRKKKKVKSLEERLKELKESRYE
jgi:hypothetical protein